MKECGSETMHDARSEEDLRHTYTRKSRESVRAEVRIALPLMRTER